MASGQSSDPVPSTRVVTESPSFVAVLQVTGAPLADIVKPEESVKSQNYAQAKVLAVTLWIVCMVIFCCGIVMCCAGLYCCFASFGKDSQSQWSPVKTDRNDDEETLSVGSAESCEKESTASKISISTVESCDTSARTVQCPW